MTGTPKVSICIPCYNQGQFLAEALQSALAQDYPNIEIVVSNNASTDATQEVIDRFSDDPRVKAVRHHSLLPMTTHWNSLRDHATGEWLLFLCADDILSPTCISSCMELGADHRSTSAIFFEYDYLIDGEVQAKPAFYQSSALLDCRQQLRIFLQGNNFPLTACLIARHAFDALGWFNTDYKFCSDWYSWTELMTQDSCQYAGYVDTPLALYRLHSANETLQLVANRTAFAEVVKMKQHFLDNHFTHAERADFATRVERSNLKLLKKYLQMSEGFEDPAVTDYYQDLCKELEQNSATADQTAEQACGTSAPYALPPHSMAVTLNIPTPAWHAHTARKKAVGS